MSTSGYLGSSNSYCSAQREFSAQPEDLSSVSSSLGDHASLSIATLSVEGGSQDKAARAKNWSHTSAAGKQKAMISAAAQNTFPIYTVQDPS